MADRKEVPEPTDDEWNRFWGFVRGYGKDGCWTWIGGKFAKGYGAFVLRGETRRAHRVAYVWMYGEPGLDLDHLCRNRDCVNPDHLAPSTPRQNVVERGFSPAALNARKTYCVNGHEFTAESTIYDRGGWRQCRICRRERDARRRAETGRHTLAGGRPSRAKQREPRPCEECGVMFVPKRDDARFCPQNCGQRNRYRRRKGLADG